MRGASPPHTNSSIVCSLKTFRLNGFNIKFVAHHYYLQVPSLGMRHHFIKHDAVQPGQVSQPGLVASYDIHSLDTHLSSTILYYTISNRCHLRFWMFYYFVCYFHVLHIFIVILFYFFLLKFSGFQLAIETINLLIRPANKVGLFW